MHEAPELHSAADPASEAWRANEEAHRALVDELAAHTADPGVRIRLIQALSELPGTAAHGVLRDLAGDGDRAVALVAAALLGLLEGR